MAAAFREEWGRIVATLIGMTGDWDLAEECAQDAFTQAVRTWARDGVPPRPGAWLTTAARHRAVDVLRRRATEAAKLQQTAILEPRSGRVDPGLPEAAERHRRRPAPPDLHLLSSGADAGGAGRADAADPDRAEHGRDRARVPACRSRPWPSGWSGPSTRSATPGSPTACRPPHLLPERTGGRPGRAVPAVQRGVQRDRGNGPAPPGPVPRGASGWPGLLAGLMPGEPEAQGMLALMLLHDARRGARVDDGGDLVTLEDQDRSRWDTAEIGEGRALLEAALRPAGRAATRCRRPSSPATPRPPTPPAPTGRRSPGSTGSWTG